MIELNISRIFEQIAHERARLVDVRDSNAPYDVRCAAVFELLSLRELETTIKIESYGKPIEERTTAPAAERERKAAEAPF